VNTIGNLEPHRWCYGLRARLDQRMPKTIKLVFGASPLRTHR